MPLLGVGPQFTHNLSLMWLETRGSHDLFSLGLDCFLEQPQNSRKHLHMFTSLLKGMIKDADKEPDGQICRVRSGKVPGTGSFVLSSWQVVVHTSPEVLL